MKKIKLFMASIFCLLLPGCSNNSVDYYGDRKNKIDLKDFFKGEVEGWGAIFDYQGRQIRSFSVRLTGIWDQESGTLKEWFEFDDGEKTERTWNITFSNNELFVGTAKDVIGQAEGQQKGNAVNLNYILEIPYKDGTLALNMDDWMYLIGDGSIILNRTAMKKFGFKVGEIVLFMKKKS